MSRYGMLTHNYPQDIIPVSNLIPWWPHTGKFSIRIQLKPNTSHNIPLLIAKGSNHISSDQRSLGTTASANTSADLIFLLLRCKLAEHHLRGRWSSCIDGALYNAHKQFRAASRHF